MTVDPQILALLTVTTCGLAMLWLATKLHMLEQRADPRCPACGRLRRHGNCGCD